MTSQSGHEHTRGLPPAKLPQCPRSQQAQSPHASLPALPPCTSSSPAPTHAWLSLAHQLEGAPHLPLSEACNSSLQPRLHGNCAHAAEIEANLRAPGKVVQPPNLAWSGAGTLHVIGLQKACLAQAAWQCAHVAENEAELQAPEKGTQAPDLARLGAGNSSRHRPAEILC